MPPPSPPRRGGLVHVVVSAVSVLAGAAVAVAVLLAAGWRHAPVHRYEIGVLLERGATAEQQAVVRDFLDGISDGKGVTLRNREEDFQEIRRKLEDDGLPMPKGASPADLPELMTVSAESRDFDCSTVAALHDNEAVENLGVTRTHGRTGVVAVLDC